MATKSETKGKAMLHFKVRPFYLVISWRKPLNKKLIKVYAKYISNK